MGAVGFGYSHFLGKRRPGIHREEVGQGRWRQGEGEQRPPGLAEPEEEVGKVKGRKGSPTGSLLSLVSKFGDAGGHRLA